MRILLVQAREGRWITEWDKKNFARSLGKEHKLTKTINLLDGDFDVNDLLGFDAVIIGGSKYGVYDSVPNANTLRQFVKKALVKRIPLLGVCFGAQFIANAIGGKVILDEKNQEFGTVAVKKTRAGLRSPLLRNFPEKFLAQCSHHDRIIRLPKNTEVLAKNRKCPIQAFKISGADIYGVQFHPERSKKQFTELLEFERQGLKNLPVKKIMRSLKETRTEKIFQNFIEIASKKSPFG